MARIRKENTQEDDLAEVAQLLKARIAREFRAKRCGPGEPDAADFREAFRPFVVRKELLARISEAGRTPGNEARVVELLAELAAVEKSIARYLRS